MFYYGKTPSGSRSGDCHASPIDRNHRAQQPRHRCRPRRAMIEERSAAASAVPATATALGQPLEPADPVIPGAASVATVKVAMYATLVNAAEVK